MVQVESRITVPSRITPSEFSETVNRELVRRWPCWIPESVSLRSVTPCSFELAILWSKHTKEKPSRYRAALIEGTVPCEEEIRGRLSRRLDPTGGQVLVSSPSIAGLSAVLYPSTIVQVAAPLVTDSFEYLFNRVLGALYRDQSIATIILLHRALHLVAECEVCSEPFIGAPDGIFGRLFVDNAGIIDHPMDSTLPGSFPCANRLLLQSNELRIPLIGRYRLMIFGRISVPLPRFR
jgi:hypothetical protein